MLDLERLEAERSPDGFVVGSAACAGRDIRRPIVHGDLGTDRFAQRHLEQHLAIGFARLGVGNGEFRQGDGFLQNGSGCHGRRDHSVGRRREVDFEGLIPFDDAVLEKLHFNGRRTVAGRECQHAGDGPVVCTGHSGAVRCPVRHGDGSIARTVQGNGELQAGTFEAARSPHR